MASPKQIAANRANAQKSTGPRSAEGKAASRLNALKSGIDAQLEIIPTEDRAELEALTAEYHDHYRPATPEERALVDIIVRSEWQLRRLANIEARFWEGVAKRASERTHDDGRDILGRDFSRLQWRLNCTQRNLLQAMDRLRDLQTARQATDSGPLTPELASFRTPRSANVPAPILTLPAPPDVNPVPPPPSPMAG